METINYLAVLVSAIMSMVIGSIWYGPLFGKKFMEAMGMNSWSPEKQAEMKKGMTMTYIWQFVASLVTFYVLAWFMRETSQMSLNGGLIIAFFAWLGFVMPLKLADALWGGKMTLFWIGMSNMLVTLLLGGAILGIWQ